MLDIREDGRAVILKVRVQPRASANEVAGVFEGALRVRVTAPPVEGAANDACRTFFAEKLGVPLSRVEIVAGHRGREKRVRISGVGKERLLEMLGLNQEKDKGVF
jgi:uncharacterized protein (TIGR00251 family)